MRNIIFPISVMVAVVGTGFAQEPIASPTCIRIVASSQESATVKFEPHGGESFEAERYYGGRWVAYKGKIITSGEQHSLTVPLSKNMMNIVRVCAIAGSQRVCASEGVHAKR